MTASAGARGPYSKTAHVREGIIDAAVEAFAASGFHATTMKEVALRAGLSERGLTHHFASKSELLTAVLTRREETAAAQFPSGFGLHGLLTMLEIVADGKPTPHAVELQAVLLAEGIVPEHPAHDYFIARYENARRYITRAFELLAERGELASSLTPSDLAAAFLALSDGLQLQWLYNPDRIDPPALLTQFLRGLIPALGDVPTRTTTERTHS